MRLLMLAALCACLLACRGEPPASVEPPAQVPATATFHFAELDIAEVQAHMTRSELSSRALTQAYFNPS